MISIQQLSRRFGQFTAVDQLSLDVKPGEVLGFLGPNGAGKSTTMKMLTGFLAPTEGQIEVFGIDVINDARNAQEKIGYLPEGAPSYGDMTVREFLYFIAEVRGFKGDEKTQRVTDVIGKVSLESVVDQVIETLSKGYKRRVGLAQAIIHDPQVLVLDEPTDGLDPNQKHQVRDLIQNLAEDKIVIVSTHILEEVTAVCTRAVIIAQGKLLFDGTPDDLLARSRYHNAINMQLKDASQDVSGLAKLDGVEEMEQDGAAVTLIAKDGQFIYPQVDNFLRDKGIELEQISVEAGRLDEVFRTITLETEVAPFESEQTDEEKEEEVA